jgi:hypothetical protein
MFSHFKSFLSFIVIINLMSSYADESDRLGQATMTFLMIDPVARSVGIGEASTCMDNDINAIFHNPSGIAKVHGGAASFSYTQWLADMKQYAIVTGYGDQIWGTFVGSFVFMDNGEIPRTIPDVSALGYHVEETFTVNQFVAGIGYGRQLTDKFSVGGHIKYIYQDLGPANIINQTVNSLDTLINTQNRESVFALDFGTIYYIGFKDLRIAMSFRNFGTSVQYSYESFNLPQLFQFGIAMDVFSLQQVLENQSLQIYLNASNPNNYSERINFGGEYSYNNLISVRMGYRFNYDEGNLSFGFGLSPSAFDMNFKLDYAYADYGEVFGAVHRFSIYFQI